MTAKSRRAKHRAAPRRRIRLSSMETLGFADRSEAATWSTHNGPLPDRVTTSAPSIPRHARDPFADWTPAEVGRGLLKRRIRWSLVLGILMIAAGLAGLGYWIYQRPAATAESARIELEDDVSLLLTSIGAMSASLESSDSSVLNQQLTTTGTAARTVFATAGTLPATMSAERSLATSAATDTLEAVRITNDALAYQSAAIPVLAVPDFQTDPDLVALDEAALAFGEWQARFGSVITALPTGAFDAITDQLTVISGDLDNARSTYVDALRTNDGAGAAAVISELSISMGDVEMSISETVSTELSNAEIRLRSATEAVEALLG